MSGSGLLLASPGVSLGARAERYGTQHAQGMGEDSDGRRLGPSLTPGLLACAGREGVTREGFLKRSASKGLVRPPIRVVSHLNIRVATCSAWESLEGDVAVSESSDGRGVPSGILLTGQLGPLTGLGLATAPSAGQPYRTAIPRPGEDRVSRLRRRDSSGARVCWMAPRGRRLPSEPSPIRVASHPSRLPFGVSKPSRAPRGRGSVRPAA
jgi:hypothetical protein